MNKRQYVFIWLIVILFYLSFTILKYEYKKYTINTYTAEQLEIIKEIQSYLERANKAIDYKRSKAFKSKILKSQQWFKMKWEKVYIFTEEDIFNKYSIETPLILKPDSQITQEEVITKTMTNFEKWVYFFIKKDIR